MSEHIEIHARLDGIERHMRVLVRAVLFIVKGDQAMSELSDKLNATADEILTDVDTLVSYNGDSNDALTGVLTKLSTGRDKLKAAITAHQEAQAAALATASGSTTSPSPSQVPAPASVTVADPASLAAPADAAAAAPVPRMILADGGTAAS